MCVRSILIAKFTIRNYLSIRLKVDFFVVNIGLEHHMESE